MHTAVSQIESLLFSQLMISSTANISVDLGGPDASFSDWSLVEAGDGGIVYKMGLH